MTAAGSIPAAAPSGLPRLLEGLYAARSPSLPAHLAAYGPPPLRGYGGPYGPALLVKTVERAGLVGRGGAGFPTARKLQAVASSSRRAVVVANGCEAEPASRKDRLLLATAPHLVFDGMALAADTVGADEAALCVHRDQVDQPALAYALSERAQHRLDRIRIRLVEVPNRYVASEESALVHFLNGGPALPTVTPPRPFERGVRGHPTLVNNVETLAHLALIARYGADWYRQQGTLRSPGSALLTVDGAVACPGVIEVAFGTTIADALAVAGGPTEAIQAVLVGGYFGSWLPTQTALATPLTHPDLLAAGAAFGAGVLIPLPANACGLAETARVLRYLAEQSAGQCGPCMFGLPAIADDLAAIAAGRHPERIRVQVTRRLEIIDGRGACRHPDGAIRLASSALTTFRADLQHHQRSGACAGVRRPATLYLPAATPPTGNRR